MNSDPYPPKDQPRLAVIDNDTTVLRDLYEFFSTEGYMVSTFRTTRRQALSSVVDAVTAFRPHIVILDLRLSSQADEDDLTGLTILHQLLSARCILYSSFITAEVLDEAEKVIAAPVDVDCYSAQTKVYRSKKTRSPAELIELANGLARTMSSAIRQDLSIRHPHTWNLQAMARALGNGNQLLPGETIADILVQLYPNSHNIVLETIDGAIRDKGSASTGRSVVLKLYRDSFEAVAFKVTHTQDALKECEHYSQYIKGRLNGGFHTSLEKFVTFWDVAGSSYRFIGSTQNAVVSFSRFYQSESDAQKILKPLEHLFKTVWSGLYNQRKLASEAKLDKETDTLFALYEEDFKLRRRFQRLAVENERIYSQLLHREIRNPVWWLRRSGEDSVILPTTSLAVTHGDLHGDNIFVDNGYSWVIDFERSGWGHIVRDFAELEVDIVTRLIASTIESESLVTLLRAVVAPRRPTEELPTSPQIAQCVEAQKALKVIAGLRAIALSVTGYQDQREYLWSLLFDAVFIATRRKIDPLPQARAVLFASILATRLEQWSEPWRIDDTTL